MSRKQSKASSRTKSSRTSKKKAPRKLRHAMLDQETQELKEMTSGSERSSLNPNLTVRLDTTEKPAARKHTQSGDLQTIPDTEDSSVESAAELIEEGQNREGELVEAIDEAPDPDQAEVRAHKPRSRKEPAYKDRNRL